MAYSRYAKVEEVEKPEEIIEEVEKKIEEIGK